MSKLIPLHFVWFVNEPTRHDENGNPITYIDSIFYEKVCVNTQHILAIQPFVGYPVPDLTKNKIEENEGLSTCVVDDYSPNLKMEYKNQCSLVFFDDSYADRLNDFILSYSSDSYHRIFCRELSKLSTGELTSFVIYESPEEIIELLKI